MSSLAALLQLASPTLPVGGFTYSRGLEAAVEHGWVEDAATTTAWIGGLLRHSVARLDAPLIDRLHRGFGTGDDAAIRRWTALTLATRETHELAAESRAMGTALARWLVELQLATPNDVEAPIKHCYLAAFALAAHRLGLDTRDAVRGYAWSWLEGSVAAAVKLVPLGQTDGQRILLELGRELDELTDAALACEDSDIGALVPGFAMASALHETQHTRLFRS